MLIVEIIRSIYIRPGKMQCVLILQQVVRTVITEFQTVYIIPPLKVQLFICVNYIFNFSN